MQLATPTTAVRAKSPLPPITSLVALDGQLLGSRIYDPPSRPCATLLVNSATATPQTYYGRFAQWAAARGVRVITYDYRGIGASLSGRIRDEEATMTDWATLDAPAALRLAKSFGDPVVLVGHSFGGQAIGLVDELSTVDAAIFIGAQFGFYRHWPITEQARYAALWYALVPTATQVFGYLPKQLGIGEDLPKNVAREWARWCRSPHYFLDTRPDAAARLAAFDKPALLYSFTDDEYAPRSAVRAFIRSFSPMRLLHRRLTPAELGVAEVGHFGFFRPAQGGGLWEETLGFVDDLVAGRAPRVAEVATREPFGILMEEIMRDLSWGRDA